MPISPWNPGGYFPFRYGAPAGAPNTSTTPVTSGLATSTGGGVGSAVGGAGSGSNVTGQTIANNLSAAPDLSSLTQLINNLNIAAQQQANAARIPGATGLETASSANIGSLLGGNIPQDVQYQLAQAAAERGVGIGSPGSDNVNSSLLRSLGLTSLDLQQLGQQDLTQAYARNPVAKLFDPTTQLITPAQQGDLNNAANRLALDWYKALHPNLGGGGGRGGGGVGDTGAGGSQPTGSGALGFGGLAGTGTDLGVGGIGPNSPGNLNWFQRALAAAGGLNPRSGGSPSGLPPITEEDYGLGAYPPITESDYALGPTDTSGLSYNIAPPPTNLGYDQPIDPNSVDPFNLYGGG